MSLAQRALDAAGVGWRDVAAVATVEGRRDHPAIAALRLPVATFPAGVLHEAAAVPRPTGGHPPVAETAALLAAGAGAVLVVPKRKSARVTVAVARAAARAPGGPPPTDDLAPPGPSTR